MEIAIVDSKASLFLASRLRFAKRAAQILAAVTVLAAWTVIIGWMTHSEPLKHLLTVKMPMSPPTALLFIAAGCALGLMTLADGLRWPRYAGLVLLAAVVLFAAMRLFTFITGWDTGLDMVLFRDQLLIPETGLIVRVSVGTAAMFVLIGIGACLLFIRRYEKTANVLLFSAFMYGVLSVTAYAYDTARLTTVAIGNPIALSTALVAIALSTGFLLVRSDGGYLSNFQSQMTSDFRWLIPIVIIFPPIVGELARFGYKAGLFSDDFGDSLIAALTSVVFVIAIYLLAERIKGLEASRDDSERRLLEAKEESDSATSSLKTFVEVMPAGVAAVSAIDGAPYLLNSKAKKILGRDFVQGAKLGTYGEKFDIVREDGSRYPDKDMPVSITMKTGVASFADDQYIRHPDGTMVRIRAWSAPIRNAGGRMTSVVAVLEDTTAEYELDRAKNDFISIAAHQIRGPITAMRWQIDLLLDGDLGKISDEQRDLLKEMQSVNLNMNDLVVALLNVARIDLGTYIVEPSLVDLHVVVDDVLLEVAPKISSKDLKIEKEFDDGLPKLLFDPGMIHIIMQNLISNAVRYTKEGGHIRVGIAKSGEAIVITVADDGYGIPQAQQSKIFTKMFRADNVKRVVVNGTGLGLWTTKAIVTQAGGTIGFVSNEGKGTTFTVKLPLKGLQKKAGTSRLS